jgi:RHS repeat-associated protein
MPERKYTAASGGGYAYGFNGKENTNEIYGDGNTVDFGARIYDGRLGRWMSLDKLTKVYPQFTPYNFSGNTPIQYRDEDGNIIRDSKGNIVFVRIGETKSWSHGGNPGVNYKMSVGYIFANDGTKILAYKSKDVGKLHDQAKTDCHGATFADGQYWIDNNQVPTLLRQDGYKEVKYEERKKNDKVIYTNEENEIEDSRTITADIKCVQGQGGLEEKSYETDIDAAWDNPKGQDRIFRKTSTDKKYNEAQVANLKRSAIGPAKDMKATMEKIQKKLSFLGPETSKIDDIPLKAPKAITLVSQPSVPNSAPQIKK